MFKICQFFKECIRPTNDSEVEEVKENCEEIVENAEVPVDKPEQEDSTFISDKNNEKVKEMKTKKLRTRDKKEREKKRKSKQNDILKNVPSVAELPTPQVSVTLPIKPLEKKPLKPILKKPRRFF